MNKFYCRYYLFLMLLESVLEKNVTYFWSKLFVKIKHSFVHSFNLRPNKKEENFEADFLDLVKFMNQP